MNDFLVNVTHVYLDTSEIEARLDVVNQGLTGIQAAMASTQSRLDDVVASLDNPDAIAAEEKVRKGWTALANGWPDDAAEEFAGALERYRYRALPHLLIGIARMESDPEQAISHFEDAIKYGAAADAPAAVSAALLAAQLLDGLGRGGDADSLLHRGAALGDSPDLLLALAARGAAGHEERARLLTLVEAGSVSDAAQPVARSVMGDELRQREAELREDVLRLLDAVSTSAALLRAAASEAYPPIVRLGRELRAGKDAAIAVGWLDGSHAVLDQLDQTLRSSLRRLSSIASATRVLEVSNLVGGDLPALVAVARSLRSRALTQAGRLRDALALAAEVSVRLEAARATVPLPPVPGPGHEPALLSYVQSCQARAAAVVARAESLVASLSPVATRHDELLEAIDRVSQPDADVPTLRPLLNLPVPVPAGLAVVQSPSVERIAPLRIDEDTPGHASTLDVPLDFVELGTPQAGARAAARPALEALLRTIIGHLDRLGRPQARRLGPYRSGVFGGRPRPTGPWAYEAYSYRSDLHRDRPQTSTVCVTVDGAVVVEVTGLGGTTVHEGFDEDRRSDPEYLQRIVLPLYTSLVNRGVVLSVDPTILALDHWHAAFYGGGQTGHRRRQDGTFKPLYPYPLE